LNSLLISLLIPAKDSAHALKRTTEEAIRFFEANKDLNNYEIILIPTVSSSDRTVEIAESLAQAYPAQVRVAKHHLPVGKGAALRTGLNVSRGRYLFFTDADLPYELRFFEEALVKLQAGYGLVSGNRRLAQSQFDIPVGLLPLAYKRHRLGLAFNRLVRILLPIQTSDTQAGIKALSRELAVSAFKKMVCPGFFFDLELFLTARGENFKHQELPVTLYLNTEKSTVKILRDSLLAGFWLSTITFKNLRGDYGKAKHKASPLRRYQKAALKTKVFLALRWWLTPYQRMADELPLEGKILDVGCGHGLLSILLAAESPKRNVIALDHDTPRIELALSASQDLPNLHSRSGSVTDPLSPAEHLFYDGISIIDTMHYFDQPTQESILRLQWERLKPGGILVMREVEPGNGFISRWNRFYENFATRSGFTKSREASLHFRPPKDWQKLLCQIGFQVRSFPCSSRVFSDILFVGVKPK